MDSLVEWHFVGEDQACLVPISDWPMRAMIREKYQPYHDREILQADAEGAAAVLAEIDARGPLSSLEFEDQSRYGAPGSWYGQTRTKRLLRSLWACGQLVTHHRRAGRHYYDRPERVIPPQYFGVAPLLNQDAYHRWIVLRRHQAAGLLRPHAEVAIWSACGSKAERTRAIQELVEAGLLTPLHIGEKQWLYHAPTSLLNLLDAPLPHPQVHFLGPLDSLLWDRKGLLQLFDFDYLWEVYKPEHLRRWGYYVLPIFYGDHFIARLDSRLERGTWTLTRWWWEPGILPDVEMLDAIHLAIERFAVYLHANEVRIGEGVASILP